MILRGAVVLLTGASGGIGRPTAALLGAAGARVVLFGRREDRLRHAAEETARAGGEALVVAGDVRRPEDAARAVREAVARFGRLDALVNLAGLAHFRLLEEATEEEIREQTEVNLLGTVWMTRAALPALLAARGAVVNVASMAGRIGIPYYSAYAATKFGVVGMTEAWRRELAGRGVRVSLVLPAAVETEFLDKAGRDRALGRGPAGIVLDPGTVARAIVRALERHPADVYLPRTNRLFALLDAAFPGISDRILRRLLRYPPSA
ncbi:MAG TPA: SDR family NAD(P)-dependent oxidoreductase [Candidatus Eisenbacteria bacterium]|nr:SDR family NAD(P)-dependent oxidoreductase [Candidatus Eisenbacteria bacterium]